jgi:hypothetical protein
VGDVGPLMTRPGRRAKRKQTVRVPNPRAPVKERLQTPPHQRHASKKDYRRRGKHGPEWND